MLRFGIKWDSKRITCTLTPVSFFLNLQGHIFLQIRFKPPWFERFRRTWYVRTEVYADGKKQRASNVNRWKIHDISSAPSLVQAWRDAICFRQASEGQCKSLKLKNRFSGLSYCISLSQFWQRFLDVFVHYITDLYWFIIYSIFAPFFLRKNSWRPVEVHLLHIPVDKQSVWSWCRYL